MVRKHGWQLPAHTFQVIAITVFCLLVVAFYAFYAPFLGGKIWEYVLVGVYSPVALLVFILYVRCTAINPADPGIMSKFDPELMEEAREKQDSIANGQNRRFDEISNGSHSCASSASRSSFARANSSKKGSFESIVENRMRLLSKKVQLKKHYFAHCAMLRFESSANTVEVVTSVLMNLTTIVGFGCGIVGQGTF